jgi:ATPase subunit of ABC transporter with duplicated ATPase domains
MSSLLTLDQVAVRAPDGRLLFENLTFALGRERVGLVGRNGVGKTSLLRLILGEIAPAAGTVRAPARVAILRQMLDPPADQTIAQALGVAEAIDRLGRIEAGDGTAEDCDAADWDLPARLADALARFGLGGVAPDRAATSLSGGQLTRAALAGVWMAAPDLLLLDEPTNSLDGEARTLVADLLGEWPGAALVVSHDRGLLRRMDRILELTRLGARLFGGAFDLYVERRAEAEAAAAHALESARRDATQLERAAQRTRERKARSDAAGRRSRARGDAPKMLLDARAERAEATGARHTNLVDRRREAAREALAAAEARIERVRRLAFDLPPCGLPDGRLVLALEDVAFAWPGAARTLDGVWLRMAGPERVALAGPNGAGKSTLIALAAGVVSPSRGRVVRPVAGAVFDQRTSLLADQETLLGNYRRLNPSADDNAAHAALARFLFRNAAAHLRAGELSGGERLRGALACVLTGRSPPQLLILDEPTNHLDLESIEAVEAALAAYDGALLVASHDESFLEAIGVSRRIDLGAARP